jgi:isoleucyl-tRNA synthetase
MAPVLAFTAEEAWAVLNRRDDDSLFLHTWYELPAQDGEDALIAKWRAVRDVRAWVQKELEGLRGAGSIGSSLQAEVTLGLYGARYDACASLGDDLRFVLITSQAGVTAVDAADGETVAVKPSEAEKCGRCWHYRSDVGHDPAHPELCGRCTANLHGEGEPRAAA